MAKLKNVQEFTNLQSLLAEEVFKAGATRVRACCGTACVASGAQKVVAQLEQSAKEKGLEVEVVKTGCQGLCQKGPVMRVEPQDIFYQRVRPDRMARIVDFTLVNGLPYREQLYRADILTQPVEHVDEVPFYKKQKRIALRNNGLIDPANIHHYIALGGYKAVAKMFSG
ncbi:MAG: NAD(P)H-dependent oxidoreductase subunit E, partial [Thermodesulfobacteriota bacterium]